MTMSAEKDGLLKFLDNERQEEFEFPVILRTQQNINSSKNDVLRRNTPLHPSRFRKPDARLVSKRGRARVYFKKIPQKNVRYAKDLWNTLVNMQWRWLILTVALVNVVAYISCAVLFYFDAWISGDFESEQGGRTCVVGIQSIRHFFMLGIETITTTGYGYTHPTEHCQLYFVVLTFSTLINILIDGAFISVVYAKLNRPKDTNIYGQILSKKAVISLRNGHLCLIVRVNDRDGKHWINSDVHMYLIRDVTTEEGELIPNHVTELEINPFGMLFWPVDIVHEIGPKSPLWRMSAKELLTTRLEILVVVSGSSVKTGQSTRNQTSYLNKEIMWGYQFSQCLDYNTEKMEYQVNKKMYNQTIPQEVPLCSAKILADLRNHVKYHRQSLDLSKLNNSKLESEQNIVFLNEVQ